VVLFTASGNIIGMQPCNYNYFFFLHASFHLITHNLFNRCLFLFLYIYIYCEEEEEEEEEVVLKERGRDGGSMGPILFFILTGTTT
jgi:hypothetical protein